MSIDTLLPCPFCKVVPDDFEIVGCKSKICKLMDGAPQQNREDWNDHVTLHKDFSEEEYIKKYNKKWNIKLKTDY